MERIRKRSLTMYTQTAYRCSYCKKYGLSKSWIQKHEERCFYNPISRSCSTCANFHISENRPSMFAMADVKCLVKVNFEIKDKDQNKVNLKTACAYWVEKPEDEEDLLIYQLDKMGDLPKSGKLIQFIIPTDDIPF